MKLPRPNWFEVIWWSIVLACTAGALVGCEQKQPQPVQSVVPQMQYPLGNPPENTVEWDLVNDHGERKSTETASGTGAGMTTNSDEAAATFVTSAPGATLPGITSTGGDGSTEISLRTLKGAAGNPLLWVGIACILCAGIALYFGLRRAAVFAAIAGGGMIVAAMLPQWAWVIIAGVGSVGLGVYLWAEYTGKRFHEAALGIVDAMKQLKTTNPAAYEAAKREIAAQTDQTDRNVIDSLKRVNPT